MADRRIEALRTPHVSSAMAAALLARLPSAMSSLALLLLLAPRYGYALAGAACTTYVGTSAGSNPLLSRWVDRYGARLVLVPAGLLNAAGLVGAALAAGHSLTFVYLALAVAGTGLPPISAITRGLWPRILRADLVPVLFGLEATTQELVFITGPALIAIVAGSFGARTGLVMTAVISVVGIATLVMNPVFAVSGRPPSDAGASPMLIRSLALSSWLVLAGSLVACFAMIEVAVVAFVSPGHAGGTTASGIVLAVWSFGSMLGGVAYGRRERHVTDRSLLVAAALIAILLAVPALSVGRIMLGGLLFVAGMAIAPCLAMLYTQISAAAPATSQTEAFGWLALAFTVGQAVGGAFGGIAVSGVGARAAIALAALLALTGVAITSLARRRVPVGAGSGPAPREASLVG